MCNPDPVAGLRPAALPAHAPYFTIICHRGRRFWFHFAEKRRSGGADFECQARRDQSDERAQLDEAFPRQGKVGRTERRKGTARKRSSLGHWWRTDKIDIQTSTTF